MATKHQHNSAAVNTVSSNSTTTTTTTTTNNGSNTTTTTTTTINNGSTTTANINNGSTTTATTINNGSNTTTTNNSSNTTTTNNDSNTTTTNNSSNARTTTTTNTTFNNSSNNTSSNNINYSNTATTTNDRNTTTTTTVTPTITNSNTTTTNDRNTTTTTTPTITNNNTTTTSINNSSNYTNINNNNNNNNNNTNMKDNIFKQPFPVTDHSGSERFLKTNLGKSFHQNQPQPNSCTTELQAFDKNVSTFTKTSSNLGPSSSTDAGSYLPIRGPTRGTPGLDPNRGPTRGTLGLDPNRGPTRGTLGLDPNRCPTRGTLGKSSTNNPNVSRLNRSVPSFSAASSFIPSSSKTFTGIKPPTTFSSKPKQFRVYVDSKNSDLDSNSSKTEASSLSITSKTNLLQISSNNQQLKKQTKINNFCANSSVNHNKENLSYCVSPLHSKDSKNIPVNGGFKERTAVSSICHNPSSKTPQRTTAGIGNNNNNMSLVNSMRATPQSGNNNNNTSYVNTMRATPPLCKCGYRAMLRLCQKPGLNMGRCFYSCSVKTRSKVKNKKGVPVNPCDFFKWESPVSPHSSFSSPALRTPSNLNSTLPVKNLSSTTNTRLSTTAPFETPKLPKQTIRPCQLIPYQ